MAASGLAIGALVLGCWPWDIPAEYASRKLSVRLHDSLGFTISRPARVIFTALPEPSLTIIDAEIRGADGAALVWAPASKVRLAWLPMLRGRLEIAEATLRRPTILVDLDRQPFAADSALGAAIADASDTARAAPVGALHIRGGLLHFVSAQRQMDGIVGDVDGSLNWPRLTDPVDADFKASWRGAAISLTARIAQPAAWLATGKTAAAIAIQGPWARLSLDGALDPANAFTGSASLNVASIGALTRLAGRTPPARLADEGAALQGEVAVSPGMIAVTGLHLNALDQNLEGALAFSFAGKPSLSGSLDANSIDLERLLARAPALVDSAGAWSMDALPPGLTGMMDLDLRLSAGEVRWRGHAIQNAAFSVTNGGGKLDVSVVEAAAYGGSLKGEAILAPTEGGFQAHAAATLKGADVGPLAAAFGWNAVSGTVDGEFALDSSGDCPAAMARALTGTASAKLSNGIVEGVSFEKALRRSERKPIDLGNDILTGRTVVNDAAVALAIDKGDARIVNAWAFGPGLRLTLAGWTDLSDHRVEARATAMQGDGEGAPEKDGARLSLDISGPWSTPIVKASANGGS